MIIILPDKLNFLVKICIFNIGFKKFGSIYNLTFYKIQSQNEKYNLKI